MIKAVIFDVDGVLIDAKDWHYEALNRALRLFGYSISRYDHLITYDGLPTRKKLEMLSMERDLPRKLHAFINEMKQAYTMEIINAKCKPLFIHEYALSRLQAMGYKLGVASNAVSASVEVMMKKAGLDRYLEVVLSNEDVSKGKPDPEIYLCAAQRLGCEPAQCLVLEDNPNGIKAATAAGAKVMEISSIKDVNLLNILRNLQMHEQGRAA